MILVLSDILQSAASAADGLSQKKRTVRFVVIAVVGAIMIVVALDLIRKWRLSSLEAKDRRMVCIWCISTAVGTAALSGENEVAEGTYGSQLPSRWSDEVMMFSRRTNCPRVSHKTSERARKLPQVPGIPRISLA